MRNRGHAGYVAWLVPFFSFLIVEIATGNLMRITLAGIVLNLVLYYLFYLGAFILFGNTRFTWPVMCLFFYIAGAGEYFVTDFRGRPIMFWDLLALGTAVSVSGNYSFHMTWGLFFSLVLTLLCMAVGWKYPLMLRKRDSHAANLDVLGTTGLSPRRGRRARRRKRLDMVLGRLIPSTAWLGVCTVFGGILFYVLVPGVCADVQMWDPVINFEKEGVLLSTVISLKNLFPQKPEGYSREAVDTILAALPDSKAEFHRDKTIPVNVICIMNESFCDLEVYNELGTGRYFETNEDPLAFYHSLNKNAQKGRLYVPVFGAMTPNSEYEFLTGNACALAPSGSVPYQFYTRPGEDSLAGIFKRYGYRTVAVHPYPGRNWNRAKVYENMGFDEFLDLRALKATAEASSFKYPRGLMSDQSDYDALIALVENKEPGEMLFLFNVTMQNHGGYETASQEAATHVTDINGSECDGRFPRADEYLSLLRMSDEALKGLIETCGSWKEPTLVIVFGDHQPYLDEAFYEEMFGMRWSNVPSALKMNAFITPYLIWSNYDREIPEAEPQSTFMLGNTVLWEAGIIPEGFRKKLDELKAEFGAVHGMGTLDRQGHFTETGTWRELDENPLIHEFHILQYERMFGKSERLRR